MADVFALPELLEMILLLLPMKDLLFAQRVPRYWNLVINNFKQIGEALFLKPFAASKAPVDSRLLRVYEAANSFPASYLECKARCSAGFYIPVSDGGEETTQPQRGGQLIALNVLLCGHTSGTSFDYPRVEVDKSKPVIRPSCERMFIVQPPIVATIVLNHTNSRHNAVTSIGANSGSCLRVENLEIPLHSVFTHAMVARANLRSCAAGVSSIVRACGGGRSTPRSNSTGMRGSWMLKCSSANDLCATRSKEEASKPDKRTKKIGMMTKEALQISGIDFSK